MENGETLISGAKQFEEKKDALPIDKALTNEAVEFMSDFFKQGGNNEHGTLTQIRNHELKFFEGRNIDESQKNNVETAFSFSEALFRESVRRKDKQNIRTEVLEANWQQNMAHTILSYRNQTSLVSSLESMWSTYETLSGKILKDPEIAGRSRRGVERLVSSIRIFEELGFRVEGSTGDIDAKNAVDFIARKDIGGKETIFLMQVKPASRNNESQPELHDFFSPEGLDNDEMVEAGKRIAQLLSKMREKYPEKKFIPFVVRMPAHEHAPDDIAKYTGLPKLGFIDKTKKIFLNEIESFGERESSSFKGRKKREVRYFNGTNK